MRRRGGQSCEPGPVQPAGPGRRSGTGGAAPEGDRCRDVPDLQGAITRSERQGAGRRGPDDDAAGDSGIQLAAPGHRGAVADGEVSKTVSDPLVRIHGIVKIFPGVVANAGIDLAILPGEVLALLGENGAGKSTLMSILAGLSRPDEGTILFGGERVELRSPRDAIHPGVGMVHQHFRLVDSLTGAENVLLGWRAPPFLLHLRHNRAPYRRPADQYGLEVDPAAHIWQLSVGERQRVEILKMLYRNARGLILDEPTAILTPQEVEQLFRAIRRIRHQERAAGLLSHQR